MFVFTSLANDRLVSRYVVNLLQCYTFACHVDCMLYFALSPNIRTSVRPRNPTPELDPFPVNPCIKAVHNHQRVEDVRMCYYTQFTMLLCALRRVTLLRGIGDSTCSISYYIRVILHSYSLRRIHFTVSFHQLNLNTRVCVKRPS